MIDVIYTSVANCIEEGAAEAATFLNISHIGYVPKGRTNKNYNCIETDSYGTTLKTTLNIQNSDATLIFGTVARNIEKVEKICLENSKCYLHINPNKYKSSEALVQSIVKWLKSVKPSKLNIICTEDIEKYRLIRDVLIDVMIIHNGIKIG